MELSVDCTYCTKVVCPVHVTLACLSHALRRNLVLCKCTTRRFSDIIPFHRSLCVLRHMGLCFPSVTVNMFCKILGL